MNEAVRDCLVTGNVALLASLRCPIRIDALLSPPDPAGSYLAAARTDRYHEANACAAVPILVVIEEGHAMSVIVAGFVKNGVVVPNAPLPEGAFVQVQVVSGPTEVPAELQEEFDAWDRASAGSLERVERLAREGEDYAPR